ncbi:MAG: DUF2079 domain-containing protein [Vulcanimicrobiota bacterium]
MTRVRPLPVILCAFMLVTFPLRLREHDTFQVEFDQANIQQYLWLMAHGQRPYGTLAESHAFGDHFDPVLYLFCLPFRWLPSFELYLLMHLGLMLVGGVAVFRLAHRKLESEWLAAACTMAYMFNPLTLGVSLYPLPHVAVGLAAFLWALALDCDPRALAVGLLVAAASVEMALLPFLGLALYLLSQKEYKKGLVLAAASLFLMVLLTQVVTPTFGAVGQHAGLDRQFGRFDYLKQDVAGLPGRLATHAAAFWSLDRTLLAQMFLATAGLFVLALPACLAFLPGLIINLAADFWGMHSVFLHYQAIVVGGLYFAAICGLERLGDQHRSRAAVFLLVGTAGSLLLGNPLAGRVGQSPERVAQLSTALDRLPPQASVLAPASTVSHLAFRPQVYSLPSLTETPSWQSSAAHQAQVDWILLDLDGLGFPWRKDMLNLKAQQILQDPDYGFHSAIGRLVLLERGNTTPLPEGLVKVIPTYSSLELVNAYLAGGFPEQAQAELDRLLGQAESPVLCYWQGRIFQQQRAVEKSNQWFERALEQGPSDDLRQELLAQLETNRRGYVPQIAPRY